MAFLIRSISRTADGREIVREKRLDVATLAIGRAAENDIHLPDLAVEQRHATITTGPGGQLDIAACGTLGFAVDGRPVSTARIDPLDGAELEFGSYRLALSQRAGEPVVVEVSQSGDSVAPRPDMVSGFSLSSVLPGRRLLAWGLLGAILLAFLAIPVVSNLSRDGRGADPAAPGHVVMDASWSPGPLSLAHHSLEGSCVACHVKPFEAVRDATCLSCHKDIADHAKPALLAGARGPMALGDALQSRVAHLFGKPGPGACTDCHTEHEGGGPMPPPAQQFCADCHGSLDRRLSDTKIGNAADFGLLHPQFKAQIFTGPGQERPSRVSLADAPQEWNGLRFSHKQHLDQQGGVARMAGRIGAKHSYGESLTCKDCHHLASDKASFLPIDMERDCESCHSLVYDRVGATYRTLRHGDVAQMRADLLALDRAPRRPVTSGRRRPGEFAQGGLYFQDFGPRSGSYVAIDRAFAKDGVCGECHIPRVRAGQTDVMPVTLRQRYFVNGWFDHEAHKQENCTSCHAANSSASAADLLLPTIKECRTCHMGEHATKTKVPSGCAMCHSFHPNVGDTALRPAPSSNGALR